MGVPSAAGHKHITAHTAVGRASLFGLGRPECKELSRTSPFGLARPERKETIPSEPVRARPAGGQVIYSAYIAEDDDDIIIEESIDDDDIIEESIEADEVRQSLIVSCIDDDDELSDDEGCM